jgi:hypothetical protein
MKRFTLGLIAALTLGVACLGLGPRPAFAADYEVTLSTIVPTASAADFTLAAFPQIANSMAIRTLTLSNYAGAAVQTVNIYRTATSSTAAAIEMTYVVPASSTVHVNFPARAWKLSNIGLNKSDTTSTVKAQVTYE